MTSITDEQKSIDANFLTINKFNRASYEELTTAIISTLSRILHNFDISGAKFALPDEEWDIQPENTLVGPPAGIRPRPNPPIAGIPAGPPPALPIGAADINLANMQLNYHNAAINREKEANLLCIKYSATLQYAKIALLTVEHLSLTQKLTQFLFEIEARIYRIKLAFHSNKSSQPLGSLWHSR